MKIVVEPLKKLMNSKNSKSDDFKKFSVLAQVLSF